MKISILFIPLLFAANVSLAQVTGKITGTVVKEDKQAAAVTVSLLRAKDSSLVKLAATDAEGIVVFENLGEDNYLICVTAVGYKKTYSGLITLSAATRDIKLAAINLLPISKELAAATVTAKKQLVEQRIDRTIVNVEASITNIGSSALEVLEKAPGVTVDRDGNVSLKGKQGVTIMIDGRPSQLSGADLASLLRGMNANQLEQIEIMTNPPAKYDAAGTAGIINIKTKKNLATGFNGGATLAYSQGRYPKTSEGFNFNYRTAKLNLFTNLSHNYQQRFSVLTIDRNILNDNDNSVNKIFNQSSNRGSAGHAYSVKLGADYFVSKQTTIGAVVNMNVRNQLSRNPNTTFISNAAGELETITNAQVNGEGTWQSISTNFNYRRTIDKKGKELTADIDLVKHSADNDLFMENSYRDAMGNNVSKADTLTGLLPQAINVYSARIDYFHPLAKESRLEAGIKTSFVRTGNDAQYDSIQYGTVVHDTRRSNHFIYEENINAAYVNFNTPLSKKITAQLGLRLENTNARGIQKTTGENFNRQYTQVFPTAFLQYKADDKNNFGLTIGRRVRRPNYQSMNPFIRFIDRYTYSQGNPGLKPSISKNIELAHTWKNMLTTTLNYTVVKDVVEETIQQKGQEAYNMPTNVGSLHTAGLAINASNTNTKWWTSTASFNLNYDKYKGIVNNDPIALSAVSYSFSGIQQFKLNKTLSAELNGNYRSGWLEGVTRIKPMVMFGAGISQQLLKKKMTIRLTARDMFYTLEARGKSRYSKVDVRIRQRGDSQVFTLGLTWNFSKGKKITPVKKSAGSAGEEQNRIGQ